MQSLAPRLIVITDQERSKVTEAASPRLPERKATRLDAFASTDEKSVNQPPTEAVDRMLKGHRREKTFKARVRAIIKRDRDILEDLGR